MNFPHLTKTHRLVAILTMLSAFAQPLFSQIPTIISFTPVSGQLGTSVTITGTNFDATPANNIVYFGAVKATVTAATATVITTIVPAGATYQPITVTTNNFTAYSQQSFSVTSAGSTNLLASSFTGSTSFTTGNGPGNAVSFDIDGDGKADLVTANTYEHSLSVLRNISTTGTIAFAPGISYTINAIGYTELKMAVDDLDSDGKPDIALTNPSAGKLLIYRNTSTAGNISFALPVEFVANPSSTGIAIADFDNDGHPDIAIVNKITLSVYKNISTAGTISLAQRTDVTLGNDHDYAGLAIGDFNADGKPDIAIAENAYTIIPIYRNSSTTGTIVFDQPLNYPSYGRTTQLCVADFNQDGKPDIATFTTNAVNILRNTSNVNGIMLSYETNIPTNGSPFRMCIGNINGDAKPDLIITTANSNFLSAYQNTSTSPGTIMAFAARINYTIPFNPNSIVAGDLDNDGKADLAATGKESAAITVLRNRQNEPYITSFTPAGGLAGTSIDIKGVNFTGTTVVKTGDSAVRSFTVLSDTGITAVVGNGTTGNLSVTNAYGTGSIPGYVFGPPPTILSFNPQTAPAGTAITIKGLFLTGTTAVSFGGVPAQSFINTSDTSVVAIVGAGASGYIRLTAATGTDSISSFNFLPPPVINNFSPDSAFTGTSITIEGKNFTGTTAVYFGNVPAQSFAVINDTIVQAVVGSGASGNVSISTGYGTGNKSGFRYLGPSVTSFTPSAGGPGLLVTITGTKFTGATSVSFGGIPTDSFTVVSSTTIRAWVSAKAISGNVMITTPIGVAYKAGFLAPPRIISFSPIGGNAGTVVTISGNNFDIAPQGNMVHFGQVQATVVNANDSSLTVIAPASASYSPISVTANLLTGYSTQSYSSSFNGGTLQPGAYALAQIISVPPEFYTSRPFLLSDMNRDGRPDLVGYAENGAITIGRNKSLPGTFQFDSVYQFTNSFSGTTLVTADLTNDGLPDIITSNAGNSIITVFKNNTANNLFSIGTPKYYFTNAEPKFIATDDIDGDGKTDIAVINNTGQTVSVIRNAQQLPADTVLFAVRVDFPVGKSAEAMIIKDLDGDRKPDIVVINKDSSTISVLRNTSSSGIISFAPKQVFVTGNSPRSIAAGDLDGDGDIDIITGNFLSYSVSVFTNTSTPGVISFSPKSDLATKNLPTYVSINDLNGDAKPDIAISQSNNSGTGATGIGIFRNTGYPGTIGFDTAVNYSASVTTIGNHFTTDLDGDGKTDILYSSNKIAVLRNKFNEAPVITGFLPMTAGAGDTIIISGKNFSGANAVGLGNRFSNSMTVLSDTIIRVIIYAAASGNVSVSTPYGTIGLSGFIFINPPAITDVYPVSGPVGTIVTIKGTYFGATPADNFVSFGAARGTIISASTDSLQVAVPPGATPEFASVTTNGRTGFSTQKFRITFPGAGPAFTGNYFDKPDSLIALPGPWNIYVNRLSDLDNDGKNDMLFCGIDNMDHYFFSYLRNNSSLDYLSFGARVNPPTTNLPAAFTMADMNGDGKPDAIFNAASDFYPAAIQKNNSLAGAIAFAPDTLLNFVTGLRNQVNVADMDGDGRLDVLVQKGGTYIEIFRNSGSNNVQSFAAPITAAQVGGIYDFQGRMLIDDFNGDRRLDIGLVTNNKIYVFKNAGPPGSLQFTLAVSITISGVVTSGFSTDFDGDGKPDIAERNASLNTISIHRNTSTNGNFSFAPQMNITTISAMYPLAVGDLDGDGKPELCGNNNTGTTDSKLVTVLKNNSTPGTISFASGVSYPCSGPGTITIGDIDGDGKPEMITTSVSNNVITILRNLVGEPVPVLLCPPVATTIISSNISGATYQWQVNTGTGFTAISDNANYGTTNSNILRLNNIPSSWYGYQYRCIADGVTSNIFSIKFSNTWRGTMSNAWENAANWSCGTMPDANTDVVINSGTVTIQSNITVRSLRLKPGVNLTVANGFTLTVLH